jgi:FkbM family methyltransferase
MTAGCPDCAAIPKVANAGQIVTESGKRLQIMHNGIKVVAGGYHGDWMAEIITRLSGHHEPQEERVFHEVLKHVPPQATMIELGGFWSYYTLWFLHQHSAMRRAIVVEPDPHHLEIGKANARLNGRQIEFLQANVGPEGIAEHDFQAEASGQIRIPQVSVPQILDEHGIPRLDLLHCDIQGTETGVLRSCMEILSGGRIRFCIVSTHVHHISGDPLTHQRCLALLRGAGGQILAEYDAYESFSGDGLIAACFGDAPFNWPQLPLSYNRYSRSLFRNPLFDLDEQINPPQSTRLGSLG